MVYVHRQYPNGLTQAEYARLSEKVRTQPGWSRMARNPRAFVRGHGPPLRSQNNLPGRLARGFHEHRNPRRSHAERSFPGLTFTLAGGADSGYFALNAGGRRFESCR